MNLGLLFFFLFFLGWSGRDHSLPYELPCKRKKEEKKPGYEGCVCKQLLGTTASLVIMGRRKWEVTMYLLPSYILIPSYILNENHPLYRPIVSASLH